MSRPDLTSNTEHQAAISAQRDAWDERESDHDDGTVTELGHPCDEMPFVDDCLGCMTWERYWAKVRALRAEQQDAEWWEGA